MLFWAQNPNTGSYDTSDLRQVVLKKSLTTNDIDLVVFAGFDKVKNCKSSSNGNIKLNRPISQINIATSNAGLALGGENITLSKSEVKVKGLSNIYNVATSEIGNDISEFEYAEADVPNQRIFINNAEHTYAAMVYVGFAPKTGTNADISLLLTTSEGKISHSIPNIPIKPNYRTNIIGNLITGYSNYIVALSPEFGGADILINSETGETTMYDYVDEYGINHGPGIEIDNVIWAPVNCGYHAIDYQYGKLYQWGRKFGQGYSGGIYDGDWDQTWSDANIPEIVNERIAEDDGQSETNAHRLYFTINYPYDWIFVSNDNLWNVGSEAKPIKTQYDPCPNGWRIPTRTELEELIKNRSTWTTNKEGKSGYWFSGNNNYTETVSNVFLPAAGHYIYTGGGKGEGRNFSGRFWSSSHHDYGADCLTFYNENMSVGGSFRVNSYSIRCVHE